MLQNAQMALDFLRYKKIKLVNIRAEDIVDGNPKLTLGLIWTIILHFQVSPLEYNLKNTPPPPSKTINRRLLLPTNVEVTVDYNVCASYVASCYHT